MVPQPKTQRLLSETALAGHFSKLKTTVYSDLLPPRHGASPSTTSHTIKSIAWSPLGNFIATGASSRTLRVWNPEKNQVKNSTELKGHASGIETVAWHPLREAELASLGSDGTVKFWDVRSRNVVGEWKVEGNEGGYSLVWRPDGEELVVGTKNDSLVRISRSTFSTIAAHKQDVQTNQCAFSWSGRELLTTTGDGEVRILDYPSFETLHTMQAHTASCTTLAFSPLGNRLAVGGSDALVTMWDLNDMLCARTFAEQNGPVRSVSFSFDGAFFVAGSEKAEGERPPLPQIAAVESGEYIYDVPATGPNQTANGCVQVAWAPRSYVLAFSGEGPTALRIVGGMGSVTL